MWSGSNAVMDTLSQNSNEAGLAVMFALCFPFFVFSISLFSAFLDIFRSDMCSVYIFLSVFHFFFIFSTTERQPSARGRPPAVLDEEKHAGSTHSAVEEYIAASPTAKVAARLVRLPQVMFAKIHPWEAACLSSGAAVWSESHWWLRRQGKPTKRGVASYALE